MIKNQLKKNSMKKIRLIINSLILFLIVLGIANFKLIPKIVWLLDNYISNDSISEKNSTIHLEMYELNRIIDEYIYIMQKYPENGKELLDFYYNNPKESELLKATDYEYFKHELDRFNLRGMSYFKKPIRIVRLKEKPKSKLTDINIELPFIAYYIQKKPKLSHYEILTYGCWRKEEKSNKCILLSKDWER